MQCLPEFGHSLLVVAEYHERTTQQGKKPMFLDAVFWDLQKVQANNTGSSAGPVMGDKIFVTFRGSWFPRSGYSVSHKGETRKLNSQVTDIAKYYEKEHPTLIPGVADCQLFANYVAYEITK